MFMGSRAVLDPPEGVCWRKRMRLEGLLSPTTEHPERQVGTGFEWQAAHRGHPGPQEGLQVSAVDRSA